VNFLFSYPISGIIFLLIAYVVVTIFTRDANPLHLALSEDGRYSVSKMQFLIWTVVVLFAYVSLWLVRVGHNEYAPITDIPASLMLAMGFSVGTAVGAKAITENKIDNGRQPDSRTDEKPKLSDLAREGGNAELSKVQMLLWTLVTVIVFLVLVNQAQASPSPKLPDIDPSLVVLMGLGQATYLGRKLVSTSVPTISGVTPSSGTPGTTIVLGGTGFGNERNGSQVVLNGQPRELSVAPTDWKDTEITFTLPDTDANGQPWPVSKPIPVGVIVQGLESANTAAFTVTPLKVTSVQQTNVNGNTIVTMLGVGFGPEQRSDKILIDDQPTDIVAEPGNWTDTQITFTLPPALPGIARSLAPGNQISVGVQSGARSDAKDLIL
jgi:IPT/TIG domain